MRKLSILILISFLFISSNSQNTTPCLVLNKITALNVNQIILDFNHTPPQELLDTGNFYLKKHSMDTALIYYSLILNTSAQADTAIQQKIIIQALNKSAIAYYLMCDYSQSYELLIRALSLCETHNYTSQESKIYNNIGNIYYRFSEYNMAKANYLKSLALCTDSMDMVALLNNLGAVELYNERIDSALYFVNKSLSLSVMYNNIYLYSILNNKATIYQEKGQTDSAYYCFHKAISAAQQNSHIEREAENMSGLGKLFTEMNNTDSAMHYIELSSAIAKKNKFFKILAENYLLLSKIEENKNSHKKAMQYFKEHSKLKDSIFNSENLGDINQLQRLYEVSKTNQQLEQYAVEQQIKNSTIYYQKIIWFITLGVLLLVSCILIFVFIQKAKLNKTYKTLFEKSIEIIGLQNTTPEKQSAANNVQRQLITKSLPDTTQQELLNKILTLMEDTTLVCDPKFSVEKLAKLTQSNEKYVSSVINTALKKNFRSFLNTYRIKEAQRLFSETDTAKYTIETISLMVGFKSRNTFNNAFKDFMGVTPHYYMKSLLE